ncbi:MAG: hypothetical protein AAF771_03175 [Pseudomonadota bacterium]
MLQEKNADLDAVKTRKLLERLVDELGRAGHDLYYSPTTEVAASLMTYAKGSARLSTAERALFEGLTRRDIEIILGVKSGG